MKDRELWLGHAAELLVEHGVVPVETPVLYSVGWPKGARGKGVARGQCWPPTASDDGQTAHVFLAPDVTDPQTVLLVLAHELCHVLTPGAGHKGAFVKRAKLAGLVGPPWTTAAPSEGLAQKLQELAILLGAYPHVGLQRPAKVQKTRMRLWECSCGIKLRRAGDLNALCLDCGAPFTRQEADS